MATKEAYSVFQNVYNHPTALSIDYNSNWANGTGYFDHAVKGDNAPIVGIGCVVKSITPDDRKIIIIGTRFGNAVLFDRYTPPEQIIACNLPRELQFVWNSQRIQTVDELNIFVFNSDGDENMDNIGKMLEMLFIRDYLKELNHSSLISTASSEGYSNIKFNQVNYTPKINFEQPELVYLTVSGKRHFDLLFKDEVSGGGISFEFTTDFEKLKPGERTEVSIYGLGSDNKPINCNKSSQNASHMCWIFNTVIDMISNNAELRDIIDYVKQTMMSIEIKRN